MQENLLDPALGKRSYAWHQKSNPLKEKIINSTDSFMLWETLEKDGCQAADRQKVFANHIFDNANFLEYIKNSPNQW